MTKDEERKAAEAIKIDPSLYQFVTEEIIEGQLPLVFGIGPAEGDYIAQFDRKLNESGIPVKEDYVNQLWETNKQVPGVDLRSGEYGVNYASAGFFHAALDFFAKGDLDNALLNFEKSIELCPYNILAREIKCQVHTAKNEIWLAAAELGNAILLNPARIAENDSASREVLEKYPEGYRELLEESLADDYFARGTLYRNLGLNEEALADLDEAVRRSPGNLEMLNWRQNVYMVCDRWDEALADADVLVAGEYELEKTYQHRGISLKMTERYWEAIGDFTAAIKINPGLTYAYLHRADCNIHEDAYYAAIDDATVAVERCVPYAHHYRGQAYYFTGQYTRAIADFDAALLEYPDDDESEGWRKRAMEERAAGHTTLSHRQNEKGEWEDISRIDDDIDRIMPHPGYQKFLDECRREEEEERRLLALKKKKEQE